MSKIAKVKANDLPLQYLVVVVVILLGVIVFYNENRNPVTYPRTSGVYTSVSTVVTSDENTEPVYSRRITAPSIGMNLPVTDAVKDEATGKYLATHGTAESISDGQFDLAKGTGYLYGHNKNSEFYDIRQLKPGDIVSIEGTDGLTYNFQMHSSEIVAGDKVEKIQQAHEEQKLVLQTCSGFLSRDRLLVSLHLVGVSS